VDNTSAKLGAAMKKLQKFIRDTEGMSGRLRSHLSTNPRQQRPNLGGASSF
jgi:hypothetical protein